MCKVPKEEHCSSSLWLSGPSPSSGKGSRRFAGALGSRVGLLSAALAPSLETGFPRGFWPSVISFRSFLWFSVDKSCTSLVEFILRRFTLSDVATPWVSLSEGHLACRRMAGLVRWLCPAALLGSARGRAPTVSCLFFRASYAFPEVSFLAGHPILVSALVGSFRGGFAFLSVSLGVWCVC